MYRYNLQLTRLRKKMEFGWDGVCGLRFRVGCIEWMVKERDEAWMDGL